MTQDEKWMAKYKEEVDFIETNRRNPSRHRLEEHDICGENYCLMHDGTEGVTD